MEVISPIPILQIQQATTMGLSIPATISPMEACIPTIALDIIIRRRMKLDILTPHPIMGHFIPTQRI